MERLRGDGAGRPPLAGCVFGGSILAAPFLASLYGLTAGLAVMTIALATTTAFGVHGARAASPEIRRSLLAIVALNGALAVVCLGVLLARL